MEKVRKKQRLVTQDINVVLYALDFKEKTVWIAQCVEFYISAQGNTMQLAWECFVSVLNSYVLLDTKGNEPLRNVEPPPDAVKKLWPKDVVHRKTSVQILDRR